MTGAATDDPNDCRERSLRDQRCAQGSACKGTEQGDDCAVAESLNACARQTDELGDPQPGPVAPRADRDTRLHTQPAGVGPFVRLTDLLNLTSSHAHHGVHLGAEMLPEVGDGVFPRLFDQRPIHPALHMDVRACHARASGKGAAFRAYLLSCSSKVGRVDPRLLAKPFDFLKR